MATWLSLMLGCARPSLDRIAIYARWDGAGAEEVEASLGRPLEAEITRLLPVDSLLVRSVPGMVELTVTMPATSSTGLADALDSVSQQLPSGVSPWGAVVPRDVSDWVVPIDEYSALFGDLTEAFGVGIAWLSTPPGPPATSLEVVLPDRMEIAALFAQLSPAAETFASAEALVDAPVEGRSLRERASAVHPSRPRSCLRWDGEAVVLLHVGRPRGEIERWLKRRGGRTTALPADQGLHIAIQRDLGAAVGASLDIEEGERIAEQLRAKGADHVLLVCGRPRMGGQPEPGRIELLAHWPDARAIPSVSDLDEILGSARVTPLPAVRSIVTAPDAPLAAMRPAPRRTWDVEIDGARAASLGLDEAQISSVLQGVLRGWSLRTQDGSVVELRTGDDVQTLDELSAVAVGQHEGAPVRLREVARLEQVILARELIRFDGEPAAILTGFVPEGARVLSREVLGRFPW